MAQSGVKLIVVTHDTAFYVNLNACLLRAGGLGIVSNTNDLSLVEGKLDRAKQNVLIVDADYGIYDSAILKRLTVRYSLRVVVTGESREVATFLIRAGFTDFLAKPTGHSAAVFDAYARAVITKAGAGHMAAGQPATGRPVAEAPRMHPQDLQKTATVNDTIIAIASSTGGTTALEKILLTLPADMPPILIVQHMPSGFTKFFADRLNSLCKLEIKEGENNDYPRRGVVYIAPADFHMSLNKQGDRLILNCYKGTKIHGVMPAADILFDSVALLMKARAIGVILTGMGADGAQGLYKMHMNGARTIGQNKETCVVYGMPKVAYDLGAVDKQLPLNDIARELLTLCRK